MVPPGHHASGARSCLLGSRRIANRRSPRRPSCKLMPSSNSIPSLRNTTGRRPPSRDAQENAQARSRCHRIWSTTTTTGWSSASPTERPSEAIFPLGLPPGRVTLCFLQGAGLPDPAKLLQGKGNVVRNIRLYNAGEPDARVLDGAEVRDLMNLALNRAKVPMPARGRRKLMIKSISAKPRRRRP